MQKIQSENLPADIRLIAAISRLIDFHQSRRESGGAHSPSIPDTAGANLYLALSVIESLHEIEMERGAGTVPIHELIGHLKQRIPDVTSEDVEFCIANLKQGREIRYRTRNEAGEIVERQTWDTTTLLDVQEGFSQVRLTENARLLLRVTSLRESWLYSDIEADRLVKVIERGQFQDIPAYCRSMILDIASKGKQLTHALERPSLSELRSLLIREGAGIATSLRDAAATITKAIDLIYREETSAAFARWLDTPQGALMMRDGIMIGNLQADLELVLQNIEALSRRFIDFIDQAQKVRHEGVEPIPFLEMATWIVRKGSEDYIQRVASLFAEFLPWGQDRRIFHPSMLVGAADLSPSNEDGPAMSHTYTLDPAAPLPQSRFADFLARNRDVVLGRLAQGPASFSEIVALGGFALEPGDSLLDFFGVYTNPLLLDAGATRIVVGLTDGSVQFSNADYDIISTDPVMYLESALDPN